MGTKRSGAWGTGLVRGLLRLSLPRSQKSPQPVPISHGVITWAVSGLCLCPADREAQETLLWCVTFFQNQICNGETMRIWK